MEQEPPHRRLRNIGIIAHIDAGKTTTTERILYYAGVTHQLGEVDEGSTQMDWMDQERERGITITSAATRFTWRDHEINLIDTPGHVDFTAEVERSLRVLDGALVVLCAVGGVEPQSEMVWHQADRYQIPRMFFVNKMDRLGANFEAVVEDIRTTLGVNPLVTHFPVGVEDQFEGVVDVIRGRFLRWDEASQGASYSDLEIPTPERERYQDYRHKLLEAVAGEDEGLLTAFGEGRELPAESVKRVIRSCTLERKLYPVLAGAALRNRGIQPLLDAVVDYLPAPDEVPPPFGVRPETGERIVRPVDPDAPFLGFVFKTMTERERGRASFLRIYSGRLQEGMTVQVPRLETTERVARLFRMHADKRRPIKEALAGDIVVATGLKLASTGDTLCEGEPLLLEGVHFPEPVVSAALEARSAGEEEKVQAALARLSGDDPTFRVKVDENTGQTLIAGMGELHLQVLEERLIREFNLKVRIGKPQVTYRETIRQAVTTQGHYDRMTGGRQHYAEVTLRVSPLGRGEGFQFRNLLAEGKISPLFVAAVETSCKDAKESGILYGYPVVDILVELTDGRSSEVNSSEFAFRNAAMSAFRDGCRQAIPILLEPIMSLEIICPKEFLGGVMGGLAARRGRVVGQDSRDEVQILRAMAPLSQMFGYTTDLRSASQGRATYSMLFSHFDEVADPPAFLA